MNQPTAVAPREWTRSHPVTPVIHMARLAAGGFVAVLSVIGQERGPGDSGSIGMVAGVVTAVLMVALLVAYLQWRANQYRLGDDALYHRSGLLFRRHRQARLDRLQAVDVVEPFIARVFGFAEAKIEVAGGHSSTISIKFLKLEQAEALRNEVVALAAGYRAPLAEPVSAATSYPPPSTPIVAAPVREIYRVPGGRLACSLLTSWGSIVVLVAAIAIALLATNSATASVGAQLNGSADGGALGMVVWFLGMLGALWGYINTNANFTAGIAADGIRLSHGLLDTRRQTLPPGRVQALVVKQPLLWRVFGWWKVTLNAAGYQQGEQGVSTLLPVGTRRDALHAMWLVLPDLGDSDPAGTISRAMDGQGTEGGFTASPARSWVFDPIQWRHRGVKATDRALLIRRGLLVREFYVIPHERTQSIGIRQGPLQRLLNLASVEIHSTKGPVRPIAEHLDLADAIALVESQAQRAREGRSRQTPEQWMAAVSA